MPRRYRRWRADAEPMALAGWHERAPLSLAQVEQRIARIADDQGKDVYTFVICLADDERPIGEVMLTDLDRVNGSAQVGIFIGESDEWGKGYGTDAVRALVDFGFAELRLERDLAGSGHREPACAALVREGRLHPRRPRSGTIAGKAADTPTATSCRSSTTSGRAAAPDRARAEPRAPRAAAAARTRPA